MKVRNQILIPFLAIILTAGIMPEKASAQQPNISYQVFYDQLSPYGQWFNNPAYGYVWVPDAGPDFVPYSTAGHWIMTEYGWTWVSDYSWGWAPFHYGRWDYDDSVGWFWVPDTEWGPSWVVWCRADGYYGWAPMQPGISLNMYFGSNYHKQTDHWMFVRDRDFQRSNLNRYYANRNESQRIMLNSTVISATYIDNSRHTTYVTGPGRAEVQKNTGKSVKQVTVQEYGKPGQKLNSRQLQIYRPQVTDSKDHGRKSAPAKVVDKQDVKQPSGRNAKAQPQKTDPGRMGSNQQQQLEKQKIQQQEQQQGKQKIQEQQQKQQISQPVQEQQKQQQEQQKQQQDQQRQQQAKDQQQKQQQDQQRQQQAKDQQQKQQQDQQKQQQVKNQQQKQQQDQQKQQQVKDQQQKQQQDQRNQQPPKDPQQQKQPQSPQQHKQEPGQNSHQPANVKTQQNKPKTPAKPANTKETSKDKEKQANEDKSKEPPKAL